MKASKIKHGIWRIVKFIIAAIYFPIFIVALLLLRVVQLIMCVLYTILGDTRRAFDMFNMIFKRNDKYK